MLVGIPLRLPHRNDSGVVEAVKEGRLVRERVFEAMHVDRLLDELPVKDLVVREEDVVAAPAAQAVEDPVGRPVAPLSEQRAHAATSPALAASAATSRPAAQ
jgi:hypothetical protein